MFEIEVSDDDGYEQTWRRLLDGEQIRGIAARGWTARWSGGRPVS
ncbi:hypothetical protein [Nonomuraea insulae]|uniref:Uncharacterized protein n=1 Tax=Nonomuraea insulae TaxID=1616787 RepID=A0ABW1D6B7_9ACTN